MQNSDYNQDNKCIDCNILITNKSTRCLNCQAKTRRDEGHSNYQGATICPQCGGKKTRQAIICRQCYNKQDYSGENHPNWLGGKIFNTRKRESYEYVKWRLKIFTRDNFTCQHCNRKTKLRAHHIQNFSKYTELQLDVNNGITLCKNCHNLFHSLFGNKNNNLSQLQWFFKNVKLNKGEKV